jgi:hypothetical protein
MTIEDRHRRTIGLGLVETSNRIEEQQRSVNTCNLGFGMFLVSRTFARC